MKRLLALIVVMLMAAVCFLNCSAVSIIDSEIDYISAAPDESLQEKKEDIKIGLLYSQSGSCAVTELPMLYSARIAIDEINSAGGINGHTLVAVERDYASSPERAAQEARRMMLEDKVSAIFGTTSRDTRKAVEEVVELYDSLLVYSSFYEGEEPSKNVLYTNLVPSQQIGGFIRFSSENLGRRVFLVSTDNEYSKSCMAYAKQQIQSAGGEILGDVCMPQGTKDFTRTIGRIAKLKPDYVFITITGDDLIHFFFDYEQEGMNMGTMPICSVTTNEATVQSIGKAAIGSYSCQSYFNTLETAESFRFIEHYRKLHGTGSVVTSQAVSSYSAIKLYSAALAQADSTETDSLLIAAAGLGIDTPAGFIRMDSVNHHVWQNVYIARVNHNREYAVVYKSDTFIRPQPELEYN